MPSSHLPARHSLRSIFEVLCCSVLPLFMIYAAVMVSGKMPGKPQLDIP